MTSDKAEKKVSKAFRDLQIALGKKRVNVSKLHPSELEELLEDQFYQISNYDISHLYGFTELHETLSQKDNDRNGSVKVAEEAVVNLKGFEDYSFNLKSHTVRIWQGRVWYRLTFRRNESGEETTDHKVCDSWSNGGYMYKCDEQVLLIRRVPEGIFSGSLIVGVTYSYVKVLNEKDYVISNIDAELIPIKGFCRRFGNKSGRFAKSILSELQDLYSKSAHHLKNRSQMMQDRADEINKLKEVTCSD